MRDHDTMIFHTIIDLVRIPDHDQLADGWLVSFRRNERVLGKKPDPPLDLGNDRICDCR